MFLTSARFLAALAVTLSLSAIHLESGHWAARDASAAAVHRAVKSDLGTVPPHASSRTVSMQLESLPRMSIVLRIPESSGSDVGSAKRDVQRAPARQTKRRIACEPVVSALTDIAKRLQPGRCVT